MRIVVIGGTGLIGSGVVAKLTGHGHEAVAAAPSTGVDTLTGEGLKEVLQGADVLVDVSNSPSFADDDVMSFFTTSTGNLAEAAREAGVGHYVALSVVGADRSPDIGYYRAKVAQEQAIRGAELPHTIVRATQFFEFAGALADACTVDGEVRVPDISAQPMAADEVSAAVARAAAHEPSNGLVEVAGPEAFGVDMWLRTVLEARGDARPVVVDANAQFYGGHPARTALLPGPDARLAETRLASWLAAQTAK
jgi:uncharacterized protein YbjT (DUF2867 family)